METNTLYDLKINLSENTKKGLDFIIAAGIVWLLISFIWTFETTAYKKSVLTFMIGSLLLPLAWGFSKLLQTKWKLKDNPLQPLGLWLNFAQLFYFPFLIFVLLKYPDYFVMAYAIITGAHLFPYAWLYNAKSYAIIAGIISLGSMLIALNVAQENMYYVPVYTSIALILLFLILFKQTVNNKIN